MANPQPDQFTKISNELLEAITIYKFNGTQLRLLLTVIRYTYGFNRKETELSLTFLSRAIQVSRDQVKREVSTLIESKAFTIIKESGYTTSRILKLNKNYDEWTIPKSVLISTQGANKYPGGKKVPTQGANNTPETGGKLAPQERNSLKKILKKDENAFFESIWLLYPKKEGKGQVSNTQKQKLYKIGYPLMKSYVEAYIKAKTGVEKQYLQNGSTFFNSGYIDYLEPVADKPKEPVKLNIIYREFEEK